MGKINFRISYLLILIFFSGNFIYSQNYTIGYDVKFRPKVEDSTKVFEKYLLNINAETKESFFKFQDLNYSDFNANIFKNSSKDIFKKYEMILYKFYSSDYLFPTKWELLKQKKEILGHKCENASISFGGREWIAWYTMEIPIQDGPYKFSGLPGLILEISSNDNDYQFFATSIEKKTDAIKPFPAIPMGNLQKEITFKENIIREPAAQYKQNLMQSNMKVSVSFNGKQSSDKEIIETINSSFLEWMEGHNNPIEKGMIWVK
ncbi:GLPGLI family protein [Halpernia sp.]|uniref:GLPGLI family protein n=1 Tax=Halpernia sp. TaxID=2782209 RepID=UPI003A9203A9